MKKAKRTRANFLKGEGAVDKYLNILYSVHGQAIKRRATRSITTIEKAFNASRATGWVLKQMNILKGRHPHYTWMTGEPNRKMARQVLAEMNRLNTNNLKAKLQPVKAAEAPQPERFETPRSIRRNAAKKRLIFAFESGSKTVKDACEFAEIGRKTFYEYMDADPDFAAQINAAAQNYKPKPKPKPKPKRRTMSFLWGLIKFDY